MNDELKELTLRLKALEDKLETVARKSRVSDLSADEIKAYLRVREAFFEEGSCGINETSPCNLHCRISCVISCRIVCDVVCDVECSCGPCNRGRGGFGSGGFGGGGRFGGLGG